MSNNYASCAFFNDAVVHGVTVMAANPGLVSYWNSLAVTYDGATLGWQFSGVGTGGAGWGWDGKWQAAASHNRELVVAKRSTH